MLLEPSFLFSAVLCNSLGSVKQRKPGQAARGIRSLPGHATTGRDPGRTTGKIPWWALGGSRVSGLLCCLSDSAANLACC